MLLWLVKWIAQSCPTLCDPMDCSLPGFSVNGIFQAGVLEWVAISFSRGSSWSRDQTQVSCICRQMLYPLKHQGSPTVFSPETSVNLFSHWLQSPNQSKGGDRQSVYLCIFLMQAWISPNTNHIDWWWSIWRNQSNIAGSRRVYSAPCMMKR